jgi:hypothetical protein
MVLPQHGLTRYLHVRLGVTEGVLWWERPRTALGIVPIGTERVEVSLDELRSLRLHQPPSGRPDCSPDSYWS